MFTSLDFTINVLCRNGNGDSNVLGRNGNGDSNVLGRNGNGEGNLQMIATCHSTQLNLKHWCKPIKTTHWETHSRSTTDAIHTFNNTLVNNNNGRQTSRQSV